MMNKRDRIEENNKINFKIEDQGLPVKIQTTILLQMFTKYLFYIE